MTFVGGRVPSTKGALIRLRDTLSFIKKGKEVLQMKRDQLAGEVNKLLVKLAIRKEVEGKISDLLKEVMEILITLGTEDVSSLASSVPEISVDFRLYSIMGVVIPRITVKTQPQTNAISNLSVRKLAEKAKEVLTKMMEMAEIETGIERLALELMFTNRKVNALEKVVVPAYEEMIRYIEDRLFEQELEEFVRTKFIRDRIRERR